MEKSGEIVTVLKANMECLGILEFCHPVSFYEK